MISTLNLSQHAILRMAKRNISLGDLEYVLEHGERVHKTGVAIYILRKRIFHKVIARALKLRD